MEDKRELVLDWLMAHGETLREDARKTHSFYTGSKAIFDTDTKLFKDMCQGHITRLIAQRAQVDLNLSYVEAYVIIEWPLLQTLWSLDEHGSNI